MKLQSEQVKTTQTLEPDERVVDPPSCCLPPPRQRSTRGTRYTSTAVSTCWAENRPENRPETCSNTAGLVNPCSGLHITQTVFQLQQAVNKMRAGQTDPHQREASLDSLCSEPLTFGSSRSKSSTTEPLFTEFRDCTSYTISVWSVNEKYSDFLFTVFFYKLVIVLCLNVFLCELELSGRCVAWRDCSRSTSCLQYL